MNATAGELLVPEDGATITTWPDVLVSGSVAAGWYIAVSADDAPPQLGRLVPDPYATDGRSWWDAVLHLSPGPHVVRAVAFRPGGEATALGARAVDVQMPPVHAVIDTPAPGHVVTDGVLRVGGWAIGRDSPVRSITIRVDGRDAGRAHIVLHRPDLPPALALSGFESSVALDGVSGDVHVEVEVLTMDGARARFGPVPLTVAAPPASAAVATRRRPRRDGDLLVVTHDLGYGGGQLWLDVLVRGLAERGRVPTVVAPADGPLRSELEARGITVEVVGTFGYESPAEYEGRAGPLTEWARAGGFRSVLANTAGAAIGVDVADRLGIPAVWALHESFPLPVFATIMSPHAGFVRRQLEQALDTASAVVFEADATRRMWLGYCADPVDAGARFHVVDYGIDVRRVARSRATSTKAQARRALGIAEDAQLLLCIATIEPRKAQALLLQAFAHGGVASEYPDAQLALVGDNGGPYSDGVRRIVESHGLDGRVHVHATTGDIDPWYLAADAFVLPSSIESMPRTLLEAAAFELPAVATAVFGVPEVFDDGTSAVLVEHADVASLADGLRRMLRMSPAQRARMGAEACAATQHRLDPAGYVDAFEKLLAP
jgi:D-inositol-3-phosphate glycosyltransferase